ncbi:MAG: glycosyltransferase family 2 protein [Candidatus Krumholzibacteria bacterium]|nr:glycosyltransferase family 2 protein [Candidatus Krumholzibacteria bacterium]
MEKISAILITLNEEKNLEACLDGIRWVDEIVVVDCGSHDGTKELALKYTDKFHYRAWDSFSRQKAHALDLASNEWVLSLDADERVTKELTEEIRQAAGSGTFDGYLLKRDNYFLGKLMRGAGWQHDYQMRLFRKSKARITDRLVHEGFEIDGAVGRLSNPLKHFTCTSLSAAFAKMNEYTSLEAIEYAGSRKSSGGAAVLHSLSAFLRSYVSRRGYRDGMHGLVLSLVNSVTTMLLYMKIWEIQRNGKTKAPLIR